MDINTEQLLAAARDAARHAHSPYSRFGVGCALATTDGAIVPGCNVENASYGLTICAERNALFAAVARGYRSHHMQAMAIYTPGEHLHSSCGACRQVMIELMPAQAQLLLCCDGDEVRSMTVAECLPDPFRLDHD